MSIETHDRAGRFLPGNQAARGHTKRFSALRKELREAVAADWQGIVGSLIEAAKAGDIAAAKLLIEHTLGKPVDSVELRREADRRRDSVSFRI